MAAQEATGSGGWPEGLKRTRQREDVYRILQEAQEPISAEEIHRRMRRKEALSTVYRSLWAFEDRGLVVKTTLMGEDAALYELNREGEHRHYAVCLGCHKLVPLKDCPFSHMEHADMNAGTDDFTVTSHKLELYGYCKDCRAKRS